MSEETTRGTPRRRWRRASAGGLIVGFWLVTMGALTLRELSPRGSWAGPGAPTAGESWFGVFLPSGEQVGMVHEVVRPQDRHGVSGMLLELTTDVQLTLLGKPTDLDVTASVWRPLRGATAEVELGVHSGGHELFLEGRVEDGELVASLRTGAEALPLRIPVGEDLLVGDGLGSSLRLPELAPGEEVTVTSLDPLTLSAGEVRLRGGAASRVSAGDETRLARIVEIEARGLEARAWVDAEGAVLRAETPLGLVLQVMPREEARAALQQGRTGGDILATTAVRPAGAEPFRGARRMRLRLDGPRPPLLPEDDAQLRVAPATYLIESPSPPLPGEGSQGRPIVAAALSPYLAAEPLLQTDHPRVRSRAEALVTGREDAWTRALEIGEWVHEAVEKTPLLSLPSALDVLTSLEGDCNEHTVLFTALARAVGVPTRIAIGLVWSAEGQAFYYHAWPEVFAGRWIPMDPTLGQPVADATHVKLFNGGIETWPRVLSFLGRLQITIEEVE